MQAIISVAESEGLRSYVRRIQEIRVIFNGLQLTALSAAIATLPAVFSGSRSLHRLAISQQVNHNPHRLERSVVHADSSTLHPVFILL